MYDNSNHCVSCGAIIPEGVQYCYSCKMDAMRFPQYHNVVIIVMDSQELLPEKNTTDKRKNKISLFINKVLHKNKPR